MKSIPYWSLSAFYFFYFSCLGLLLPYWSLYLHSLGFDAQAIGELMAILLATKIIAPNIWGWLADYTGKPLAWLRLSALLTVLCFLGVFMGQSYLWLALVMGLFSFFWHAGLTPFEAITLAHLGEKHSHRYSHLRLWGSIGFIVTVILGGWLFKYFSITLLPTLLISLFTGILLTSFFSFLETKKTMAASSASTNSFYQVLKQPQIIALFLGAFLLQVSHGPYYTFYSIYLEGYGYSRDLIGQLWGLAVIAEVGVFIVMHRLLKRFSLKLMLIISLVLTSMRWLLIGYYLESLPILLFAQLLHAASFAMHHGVMIQFICLSFAKCHFGRAQALYTSLSFGAGNAVGSLLSGYSWDNAGAQFTYLCASLICGVTIWISWRWVDIEVNSRVVAKSKFKG